LPGLEPGDAFYYYFVHSFIVIPDDLADVAATAEYGEQFPSVVVRDNVWGTQFHPEKSSEDGLALIKSWVETVRTSMQSGAVRQ
jgi:glutamine amidotransferase